MSKEKQIEEMREDVSVAMEQWKNKLSDRPKRAEIYHNFSQSGDS